jgi:ribosomal protein L16 Arg81 hydroxylase
MNAIPTFADFLQPVKPDEFFRDVFAQKPLHIKGDENRFAYLLTWDAVNRILQQHRLQGPRVRFARGGNPIDADYYSQRVSIEGEPLVVLRPERVKRLLREDATLVIDAIDEGHEPISDLCRTLEVALGSRVFMDAFASWRHQQGFKTHWDPENLFIVQVSGVKYWRIFKPQRLHPTAEDKNLQEDIPVGDPYWQGCLRAGDLLYIPGGWWHDAVPTGSPTLHLAASTFPPTGLTLAQALLRRLADSEFIRTPLRQFTSDEMQASYLSRFRHAIDEALQSTTVQSFLHELDSSAQARFRMSLPWSALPDAQPLPPGAWMHWLPPRSVALQESADVVTLRALGSVFSFPMSIAGALQDLMDSRKKRFGEWRDHHPDVDAHELAIELISRGLVAVADDACI